MNVSWESPIYVLSFMTYDLRLTTYDLRLETWLIVTKVSHPLF